MTTIQQERSLRRRAARQGFHIVKSRCRTPEAYEYGRYMLVHSDTTGVVLGASPVAFSADLEDIEEYLNAED